MVKKVVKKEKTENPKNQRKLEKKNNKR